MAKSIKVENKVEITEDVVDVVRLLADDNTVQQVADQMGLNKRTLEQRIVLMKRQCGTNTLYGLVALFFRNKLIK